MIKYEYKPLSAEDYCNLADTAVRAREKHQTDIADLIMDRLEVDLVLIGSATTQNNLNVNIDPPD